MIATFPNVVMMVVLDPVDLDHTMATTYSMVRPDVAARLPLEAGPNDPADPDGFIARGVAEDNEMSEGVQRGLRSGANAFVEFGRHESAAGHYHATLDDRLAR